MTFQSGDEIFIDQLSISTTTELDATQTTLSTNKKLIEQRLGPFCVVAVCSHLLFIAKCRIDNAVRTDRAMRDQQSNGLDTAGSFYMRRKNQKNPETHKQSAQCMQIKVKADATWHGSNMPEYKQGKIGRHDGAGENVWHVVCLYGYTTQDDTTEPTDRIPQHYVARYRSWKKASKKRHPRSANRL